jgi:hypothetical protein
MLIYAKRTPVFVLVGMAVLTVLTGSARAGASADCRLPPAACPSGQQGFDRPRYERERRPSAEDERERRRLEAVRRARNDPPITEIWSGKSLNDLLLAIQQMHARHVDGDRVPLDGDVLRQINVNSGSNPGGSLGLIRDGGKLHWPLALMNSAFQTERKRLDDLSPLALRQAAAGAVDGNTVEGMVETVDTLALKLKQRIDYISANDYIKAKRFLNDLEQTCKVLQDPEVSNYATHKWSAQGNNVRELVDNMTRQGLHFAPATPGDEAAYVALHRALVAYLDLDPCRPWDPYAK